MGKRTVLLIGGPGGSGKTTLAEIFSEKSGYAMISEDTLWGELKAGCPPNDWRTEDEETIIQARVIELTRRLIREGRDVVLEFILYSDPPRPLLAYKNAFDEMDVSVNIVVLNPSRRAILDRKRARGRENEQNDEREIELTGNQSNCLSSPHIDREWLIDNSEMTAVETYEDIVRHLDLI